MEEMRMSHHDELGPVTFPWSLYSHMGLQLVEGIVPVFGRRIPGTGKPGGLPSMGSYRVRHD